MQFWWKAKDISARIAQRNDRKEIAAMLSDDGAMQKVYDTFMKVAKETGSETGVEGEAKYSLQETTDGRTVAVIDSDVLQGVYNDGKWSKAKFEQAKEIIGNEFKKFKDGVFVNGVHHAINARTREHYGRSTGPYEW